MAVKIEHFGTAPRNDQGYIADRNLYLDAEGNLVEEDNPAQVRQLVGKGGALSTADAEKYGLLKKGKAAKAETEAETTDSDDEQDSSASDTPAKKTATKKGAK